jgi:hypothetical protein
MPSRILILLFFCISVIASAKGGAQQCILSKAPGWSDELRQLYADCSNTVSSPDGSTSFQIGPLEQIRIIKSGHALALVGNPSLVLPAVISWSPSSTGFFLNDGKGSGLSSQLRLFRIAESSIKEDDTANHSITEIYRDRTRCSSAADNPNVYGVGWSEDGKTLYAIAQSTVNSPCGEPTRYLGFVVDAGSYKVKQVLSTQQTKAKLNRFLPQELR